jgi:hypothetical protein
MQVCVMRSKINQMSEKDRENFAKMWRNPASYPTDIIGQRFGISTSRVPDWAHRFGLEPRPAGVKSASHFKKGKEARDD